MHMVYDFRAGHLMLGRKDGFSCSHPSLAACGFLSAVGGPSMLACLLVLCATTLLFTVLPGVQLRISCLLDRSFIE